MYNKRDALRMTASEHAICDKLVEEYFAGQPADYTISSDDLAALIARGWEISGSHKVGDLSIQEVNALRSGQMIAAHRDSIDHTRED